MSDDRSNRPVVGSHNPRYLNDKTTTFMSVSEFLNRSDELELHSGNINSFNELRSFNDQAEQLQECLKLELRNYKPNENDLKSTKIRLCQEKYCWTNEAAHEYNRSEYKITLKVFLYEWKGAFVRTALQSTLEELGSEYVESLIVALPPLEDDDLTLDKIKPVWEVMQQLVNERKAVQIGIADAEVDILKALFEWAEVKPGIDHYTMEGCCSVPDELNAYAKQQQIQLLTHHDPVNFLPSEALAEVVKDAAGVADADAKRWHPHWVARFTVMIKSRSIISHKAYIANIAKTKSK